MKRPVRLCRHVSFVVNTCNRGVATTNLTPEQSIELPLPIPLVFGRGKDLLSIQLSIIKESAQSHNIRLEQQHWRPATTRLFK